MNKDTLSVEELKIKKMQEIDTLFRINPKSGVFEIRDFGSDKYSGMNHWRSTTDMAYLKGVVKRAIDEAASLAQQETIQALEEIIGEDEPLTKKQKTRRYLGQYKYGEDVEIDTPHENRDANKARNELRAELRKKLSSLKEIKDEK